MVSYRAPCFKLEVRVLVYWYVVCKQVMVSELDKQLLAGCHRRYLGNKLSSLVNM